MTEFISQVKAAYDVVIFDTTPILPATDATILGSKVDGVVILYRVGKIARGALKEQKYNWTTLRQMSSGSCSMALNQKSAQTISIMDIIDIIPMEKREKGERKS